jgi:hypothetical protein
MMARVGYLTALVSGRPDGQLLQPPRRLFPAVSLAEAELALQQVPAPAEPPPGAAAADLPGPASAGQRGMITAGQRGMITAGQRGTASSAMDPGPAEPAPRDRAGHPGRASVAPRITASRRPVAAPDEPQAVNAAGRTAGLAGHPGHAAAAILGDGHPGAPAATGFDAGQAGTPVPVPPVADGIPRPSGPPGEPVVPVAIRTGAALDPAGKESAAAAGQARAEPVISVTAGRSAGSDASAAGAGARGNERYPRHETAAGKRYRATAGVEAEAAAGLEGPGSAGVPAPRRRPGAAADHAAVPQHAAATPGAPLSRRQGDMSAARTSPATLSIGTIEVTVLPPSHTQSPAQPEAPRPVPVNPPERLSRGTGPWFGWNQA